MLWCYHPYLTATRTIDVPVRIEFFPSTFRKSIQNAVLFVVGQAIWTMFLGSCLQWVKSLYDSIIILGYMYSPWVYKFSKSSTNFKKCSCLIPIGNFMSGILPWPPHGNCSYLLVLFPPYLLEGFSQTVTGPPIISQLWRSRHYSPQHLYCCGRTCGSQGLMCTCPIYRYICSYCSHGWHKVNI